MDSKEIFPACSNTTHPKLSKTTKRSPSTVPQV